MNMNAIVIRADRQNLLVRDEDTELEVLVHFRGAGSFSAGDRVRITHNGQMTHSIPPQITATGVQRLSAVIPPPQSTPSEMRAQVLQRGRDFLIVRNLQNRRQLRVEFPFAHHFCTGQRVIVRYDTITMGNPPRVTATDITPMC